MNISRDNMEFNGAWKLALLRWKGGKGLLWLYSIIIIFPFFLMQELLSLLSVIFSMDYKLCFICTFARTALFPADCDQKVWQECTKQWATSRVKKVVHVGCSLLIFCPLNLLSLWRKLPSIYFFLLDMCNYRKVKEYFFFLFIS